MKACDVVVSGFARMLVRGVRPGGWVLLAAIATSGGIAPLPAQLSVDQMSLVLPLAPGSPRTAVLTVRNDGPEPVQAVVGLEDWDRDEHGQNRFHTLGTVAGSCHTALSVFPPTLSIDPGSEEAIRITIDSAATLHRECWALVVVEKIEPPASAESGVRYRVRAATKVYVQPTGLPLRAEIEAIRVGIVKVGQDSVRGIEVVVHNAGGRHLEGTLTVQVRRADNSVAGTIQLPRAYVLAGAMSRLGAPFPSLPAGRYVLLALLDYGGGELAAAQVEFTEK